LHKVNVIRSFYEIAISKLPNITCHIESYRVISHLTRVKVPRLNPSQTVADRLVPKVMEGWVDHGGWLYT